jgi:nucleoside-diphosphate-sugar epimerase
LASHIAALDIEDLDAAIAHAKPALADLAGGSLFITGGTGFIGRWLLAVLARANATLNLDLAVTVLTRSRAAFSHRCPQLADDPMIHWVEGDIRSFAFPKGTYSHVIHAATDTSADADGQPLQLIDTIVNGTRRVLEFCRSAGAHRVLLLSSGAVYGSQPDHIEAISEDYPGACATTDRRAAYGQGKRLAEQLGTIFHADFALDVVIGRLFAFVGPGMPLDAHFAIGNFIRDAVSGRKIIVASDGSPVRSYLYAGDLAAWLLRLLVAGRAGAVYNVGSDEPISIADLAALVAHTVPGANGYAIKGSPKADAFHSRYVPAITRARNELGADVWTPLDEAIRRTARWASSRQQATAGSQRRP